MNQGESRSKHRLGPLVAGSRSSELCDLAGQDTMGLRLLGKEDQERDYYRTRCGALTSLARGFFYNYSGSSSLIFQKIRETPLLPDFVEYIYCWLAEDRLCGAILSGVTSDAGSHAQINEQEGLFREHAAEVAQALSSRYPESLEHFVNLFNFAVYPTLPQVEDLPVQEILTGYPRLVTAAGVDGEPGNQVETHYCGPTIRLAVPVKHDSEHPHRRDALQPVLQPGLRRFRHRGRL